MQAQNLSEIYYAPLFYAFCSVCLQHQFVWRLCRNVLQWYLDVPCTTVLLPLPKMKIFISSLGIDSTHCSSTKCKERNVVCCPRGRFVYANEHSAYPCGGYSQLHGLVFLYILAVMYT